MFEDEPTFTTPTEAGDTVRRALIVRVLAHPDPARVGDFAPLFDFDAREGAAVIHRLAPDLRSPDGALTGPLASARITRVPLRIERVGEQLRLRSEAGGPGVEVNGRPLAPELTFAAEEVAAGLVILFGKYLALWLGWFERIEPAQAVSGLIGESTAMRRLRQQIHRIADTDVPVLLRGETGVGKEVVAAAIHAHGRRAAARYVAVNVAGIPPGTAASELFGHARGAFTGATDVRQGYFQQAEGGTLFLDEIGDVPYDMQALLLRAVQHGVIQPLGGTPRKVDVRLVAATDSDLEAAIARRDFREPLLRRFSYEIRVPPLRERREDVGLLFHHLLRERLESLHETRRLGPPSDDAEPWIPATYVAILARYDWPGNVRELANVVLNFAVENRDRPRARVTPELLRIVGQGPRAPAETRGAAPPPDTAPPSTSPEPRPGPAAIKAPARTLDDDAVLAALAAERFSREAAARRLGVSKSFLYRRLQAIPSLRTAANIPETELRTALELCAGDVARAAAELRVSARALKLQLGRIRSQR